MEQSPLTFPAQATTTEPQEEVITSPQQPSEELRTLYLTGFPFDVKPREVSNLLRFLPGFVESTLKSSGVAFALFSDGAKAHAALILLNGLEFDPQMRSYLRVELAKQNSKRKREDRPRESSGMEGGEGAHLQREEKRSKHSMSSVHPSLLAFQQYYAGAAASMSPYAFDAYGFPVMPAPVSAPSPRQRTPTAPCCTVYISNLSLHLTEHELMNAVSHLEGYSRMQLFPKAESLSAFVQFKDLACASTALQLLPSFSLPSADGVHPIRVEYARNEMVVRDDSHSGSRAPPPQAQYPYPYKH